MLNAGKFNQKIEFQKVERTKDEMCSTIETLVPYYSCYAYASGLSGKEQMEAAAQHLQETINFTVRYIPMLANNLNTKDYVIKFRNTIFNIIHIDNYQFKNETLKISAIARDSEGTI